MIIRARPGAVRKPCAPAAPAISTNRSSAMRVGMAEGKTNAAGKRSIAQAMRADSALLAPLVHHESGNPELDSRFRGNERESAGPSTAERNGFTPSAAATSRARGRRVSPEPPASRVVAMTASERATPPTRLAPVPSLPMAIRSEESAVIPVRCQPDIGRQLRKTEHPAAIDHDGHFGVEFFFQGRARQSAAQFRGERGAIENLFWHQSRPADRTELERRPPPRCRARLRPLRIVAWSRCSDRAPGCCRAR